MLTYSVQILDKLWLILIMIKETNQLQTMAYDLGFFLKPKPLSTGLKLRKK